MFDTFPPEHTVFAVIDLVVYALEFFIAGHLLHRVLLPLVAKDEADESLSKTFLTLMCTGIGAAVFFKYLSPVGLMFLHPVAVGLVLLLLFKNMMWMTYKTSAIATGCCALLFSAFLLLNGQVINRVLPLERNTLLKQIGLYSDLMEEVEFEKEELEFDAEQLLAMKRNLQLQKEA